MIATYISNNSFSVSGDRTVEFYSGRRLKLDCGIDSIKYSTVLSSSYSDPNTVVLITEDIITINLATVLYGIVGAGEVGSLPTHTHIGNNLGGNLKFIWLEDTPVTYSGTENLYLMSTGSGIEFSEIQTPPSTFLDLIDTPSSYEEGKYLVSTASGSTWATILGTSYEETDPIFSLSPAAAITILGISSWDEAFSWGNHANVGYLTEIPTQSGIGASTFLELIDTPITYSGVEGKYLTVTSSGIEFITLYSENILFTTISGTANTVQEALENLYAAIGEIDTALSGILG